MKRVTICAVICFLVLTGYSKAFAVDATDWRIMTKADKVFYLKGFYDGLIFQELYGEKYSESINWKMTYLEMASALDEFYSDYKNQNIESGEALVIFNMEIQGVSKDGIEEAKRFFRVLRSDK
jgi:hypothetical protein